MRGPIEARPERTPTEIDNDAKAADVFFARWNWVTSSAHRQERWVSRRDLERRIRAESYSGRLTACEAEARGYSYTVAPNNTYATKKLREAALSARENAEQAVVAANRRPYVTAKVRRQMPKPRATRRPYKQRAANRRLVTNFWSRIESPLLGPGTRSKILTEANSSFQLWLLKHPQYGPLRNAPDGYTGSIRIPNPLLAVAPIDRLGRYKAGRVSPVGMTLDRAMEIALAAAQK